MTQAAAYCNIANLQPLWALDNISKGDRKAKLNPDGDVIVDEKREIRVSFLLPKVEVKGIDDWQFANRMRTRSDAIRAMMRLAFDAKKPKDDNHKP